MKTNKIIQGSALEILKTLPEKSINMCMTSPPYWALRDYGSDVETIWDGDENCEHNFEMVEKKDPMDGGGHGDRDSKNSITATWEMKKTKSGFCNKCGAWKGQLGLETTFDLYIKHLCDIFDEVKRVLRDDGTCFVNLGDTYGGTGTGQVNMKEMFAFDKPTAKSKLPSKCLIMIPMRFAIEMVNRGWILRNVIIWHKRNCMPSSVKDRFTVDFEYLFFFSKKKKYYFETQYEPLAESSLKDNRLGKGLVSHKKGKSIMPNSQYAIKGACIGTRLPYSVQPRDKEFIKYRKLPNLKEFSKYINDRRKLQGVTIDEIESRLKSQAPHHWFNGESFPSVEDYKWLKEVLSFGDKYDKQMTEVFKKSSEKRNAIEYGRNKRTVWTINPKPFKESHFAVYPEELCETPIKAGCPKEVCVKCGNPKILFQERENEMIKLEANSDRNNPKGLYKKIGGQYQKELYKNPIINKGHKPTCSCNVKFTSGIVLDPFFGAGTTGLVALKQNKKFVGIELNPEYIKIAEARIKPFMEQKKL